MGCGQTRLTNSSHNRVHVLDAKSPIFAGKDQKKINPVKDLISSIDEFRVVHTDFISEKSSKVHDDYKLLLPPIGKGIFSEVRRAIHRKTSMLRAIKIISFESFTSEEQNAIKSEVNVLEKLDHPNTLKFYEFYQDSRYFYIVTELYTGGQIYNELSKVIVYNESQAAQKMRQIMSALAYCHSNKIIHGDIRPENILYESKKSDALLKVIHFRTSKVINHEAKVNPAVAFTDYTAPEIVRARKYTEKCDVWSCGIILYVLLSGRLPPFLQNTKNLKVKAFKSSDIYGYKEWDFVSCGAKNLLSKMLQFDPKARCSANEALTDKWINKYSNIQTVNTPLTILGLKNLQKFRVESKLQEAVWIFLITYLTTKEEKSNSFKSFQQLDINGDGKITREELIKGYQKILKTINAEEEVDEVLKLIDYNKNGAIDYTEFVIANASKQDLLSTERLQLAFEMIDKDGNGYITANELQDVFSSEKHVKQNVWQELIKEVDQDDDGKISFKEFKDMMTNFLL